nr:MAG TPA: hypothetical protein [Caudoviricetes sp.]
MTNNSGGAIPAAVAFCDFFLFDTRKNIDIYARIYYNKSRI